MTEGNDLIGQQWPLAVAVASTGIGALKAWQLWLDVRRLRLAIAQLERERPNSGEAKVAKQEQQRKLRGTRRWLAAGSLSLVAVAVLLLMHQGAASPTRPQPGAIPSAEVPLATDPAGSTDHWSVDWEHSVLHVVPLQFQITDGNETELQFQIAVGVTVNGVAHPPWNPGRQSIRIDSWSWYPFTFEGPRSLDVSLAGATGAGAIDVHIDGQWARVREGLPELKTINHAQYVRNPEHRGKTYALPNGETFQAPLSISNFSISQQDLAQDARKAAGGSAHVAECNGQRCITVALAPHQYDAFGITGVREVLVEYQVSATITFRAD